MATEKTDVVIVGMGAAGAILAAELSSAGMKVIGLNADRARPTRIFRRVTNCVSSSARTFGRTPSASR